ncbi:MAG: methyltransferase domain-containing protein [Saprospiraceae bacterium]|nr:methyltransferase domain-containing protein [Saprospiraceae bacterium]
MQKTFYQNDLSLIHDQGHGALSKAAYLVIQELSSQPGNVVVDLGCGSGILLQLLDREGLELYGTDIAEAMIHLAK